MNTQTLARLLCILIAITMVSFYSNMKLKNKIMWIVYGIIVAILILKKTELMFGSMLVIFIGVIAGLFSKNYIGAIYGTFIGQMIVIAIAAINKGNAVDYGFLIEGFVLLMSFLAVPTAFITSYYMNK